jgi:GNAT superfamily N-acetyltransferase
MTVRLHTAVKADAAALAALGARTFTDTFGHLYDPDDLDTFLKTHAEEHWAAELCDPEFAVLMVEAPSESGAEAVGYAKLGPPHLPFEPRGTAVELRQFYLVEQWQGKGLADEMMRWVIDQAEQRGGDDLYLSVFVDNHRARRFYERWGFVAEGRYAFMVGSHADEDIVMRRPL